MPVCGETCRNIRVSCSWRCQSVAPKGRASSVPAKAPSRLSLDDAKDVTGERLSQAAIVEAAFGGHSDVSIDSLELKRRLISVEEILRLPDIWGASRPLPRSMFVMSIATVFEQLIDHPQAFYLAAQNLSSNTYSPPFLLFLFPIFTKNDGFMSPLLEPRAFPFMTLPPTCLTIQIPIAA